MSSNQPRQTKAQRREAARLKAKELEIFPRDPGAVPDWMKIGA